MVVGSAHDLIGEVTSFLAALPTAEEIIAFTVSEAVDQRLHELLDRNAADALTANERIELSEFMLMNHFLIILKAKVRLNLDHRPPLNFPVVDLGPWPEGLSLRREDMYGDDGR